MGNGDPNLGDLRDKENASIFFDTIINEWVRRTSATGSFKSVGFSDVHRTTIKNATTSHDIILVVPHAKTQAITLMNFSTTVTIYVGDSALFTPGIGLSIVEGDRGHPIGPQESYNILFSPSKMLYVCTQADEALYGITELG